MNIVRNEKLIQRNSQIAKFTMLGGLLVLGGGMIISFRYQDQVALSLGALLVGFLLSQIGIYFSNRWGRRPRPDELIDQSLKGLDNKFMLYHYSTPVQHLLVGPSGIWILLPYYQRGTIGFKNGRWQQRGGNLYLKLFAQESLGRPDLEMMAEMDSLQKFLSQKLPDGAVPQIQAALVFFNPKVVIDIPEDADPPAETVTIGKLKELVRKPAKGKGLAAEKVKTVQDVLTAG